MGFCEDVKGKQNHFITLETHVCGVWHNTPSDSVEHAAAIHRAVVESSSAET